MPGTETEDEAFGLTRRRRTTSATTGTGWTTLVGMTESQAQPLVTESLEADIQALGGPTQNPPPLLAGTGDHAGGDDDLPPTLPWTAEWDTMQGGSSNNDLGAYYQTGEESESGESHRRRRLHAAGLN